MPLRCAPTCRQHAERENLNVAMWRKSEASLTTETSCGVTFCFFVSLGIAIFNIKTTRQSKVEQGGHDEMGSGVSSEWRSEEHDAEGHPATNITSRDDSAMNTQHSNAMNTSGDRLIESRRVSRRSTAAAAKPCHLPIRTPDDCVDTLSRVLEAAVPPLEVYAGILRIIAEFLPWGASPARSSCLLSQNARGSCNYAFVCCRCSVLRRQQRRLLQNLRQRTDSNSHVATRRCLQNCTHAAGDR